MIVHRVALHMEETPARIEISDGRLDVTAGAWPDLGGAVARLPHVSLELETSDRYLYADRQGGVVLSDGIIGYGEDGAGRPLPMLDLLAWRGDDEWHVKELCNG